MKRQSIERLVVDTLLSSTWQERTQINDMVILICLSETRSCQEGAIFFFPVCCSPAALNRPGQLASTSQHLYRFYQIVLLHSEANLMLELVKEPLTPGPKVEYVTCFRYTNAQNIGARLMERHLTSFGRT